MSEKIEPRIENQKSIEDISGIGKTTADKLKSAGYTSVEMIARSTKEDLRQALGYKTMNDTVKKIWAAAINSSNLFMDANTYRELRNKTVKRISTGSKKLDEMLGGGIETCALTEISGDEGYGKTQICHELCVNVQLPVEFGGLGGHAIFFTTEDTFRPERIVQIGEYAAKKYGLQEFDAIKGITVAMCYTSDHQKFLLDNCSKIIEERGTRLIIVDSLISNYRQEYVGRETLAERQQLINQYLMKLDSLANYYKLAAVCTTQVQAVPDQFHGGMSRPTGGHIVGHGMVTRLQIVAKKKSIRVMALTKSPMLPEGERTFKITENGIEDIEEEEKDEEKKE